MEKIAKDIVLSTKEEYDNFFKKKQDDLLKTASNSDATSILENAKKCLLKKFCRSGSIRVGCFTRADMTKTYIESGKICYGNWFGFDYNSREILELLGVTHTQMIEYINSEWDAYEAEKNSTKITNGRNKCQQK